MEVKIQSVIVKLSIFSEKIVKIKSGKYVGSASFHEEYPLKGIYDSDLIKAFKMLQIYTE